MTEARGSSIFSSDINDWINEVGVFDGKSMVTNLWGNLLKNFIGAVVVAGGVIGKPGIVVVAGSVIMGDAGGLV